MGLVWFEKPKLYKRFLRFKQHQFAVEAKKDLVEHITTINPIETPFITAHSKPVNAKGLYHQWLMDDLTAIPPYSPPTASMNRDPRFEAFLNRVSNGAPIVWAVEHPPGSADVPPTVSLIDPMWFHGQLEVEHPSASAQLTNVAPQPGHTTDTGPR
jgi:hypothetical protein